MAVQTEGQSESAAGVLLVRFWCASGALLVAEGAQAITSSLSEGVRSSMMFFSLTIDFVESSWV